jgi:hypothetical protein
MALELAGEGGDTEEDDEVVDAVEINSKQRPTIGEGKGRGKGKQRAQATRDLDSGRQQRDREPHLPIILFTS